MKKSVLLLSLMVTCAMAQTPPPRTVTVTVTGPDKYEDKTPIPADKVKTYNIYVGTCGTAKTRVNSGVGAVSKVDNVTPGQCLSAEAIVDGVTGPQAEVVYHGRPGAVTVFIVSE